MSIAELLQLCLIGQRTGMIKCSGGADGGTIFVEDGHIVHATWREMSGEDAFYALLADPRSQGDLVPSEGGLPSRSIHQNTEFLLMEAARRADEHQNDGATQDTSASFEPSTAEPAPRTRDVTYLSLISEEVPKNFLLTGHEFLIGRGTGNHVSLQNTSVSHRHCVLTLKEGTWFLTDCQARNGTFLNGQAVSRATAIQPGDLIQLGAVLLRCEGGNLPSEPPAAIKPPLDRRKETKKLTLPLPHEAPTQTFSYRSYQPVSDVKKQINFLWIGLVIVLIVIMIWGIVLLLR